MTTNIEELRLKIDILEQLLSKKELKRISVSKRFKRIRRKISKYLMMSL